MTRNLRTVILNHKLSEALIARDNHDVSTTDSPDTWKAWQDACQRERRARIGLSSMRLGIH